MASKWGSEFTISQMTAEQQANVRVVGLADGRFFALWDTNLSVPGALPSYDIVGRFFNADGTPSGAEFTVNQTLAGDQGNATITELSNGNVAIVFNDSSETGADTSATAIRVQIVSPTGSLIGSEIVANTTTDYIQRNASIAGLPNGNFAVTWDDWSASPDDPSDTAVRGQLFSSAGARVGSETLINATTTNAQSNSHIAALTSGTHVTVWTGFVNTDSGVESNVYGRLRSDSTGAQGPEFVINEAGARSPTSLSSTTRSGSRTPSSPP